MFREPTYIESDAAARGQRAQAASPRRRAELRPLRRMLPYLRPYRAQILGAIAALTVSAGTVLAVGACLRALIDRGFSQSDGTVLDQALLVLLAVTAVMAVSTFARFYLVSWVGERVIADLRRAIYGHLVRLSPGFFESTKTAEIITRLTADTTVLQVVIGSSASIALRNLLMLVGGLAMMLITSPKLTGLVLLVVPLVVVPLIWFGRQVRRLSRLSQDRIADVGAQVDETLHGIRTVQAFGNEGFEERRYGDRVAAALATALDRVRSRAFLTAGVILLVFTAIATVLWLGGHDVLDNRITAGDLSAFVFYAVLVAGAVGAVSEVYGDLQRAAGATERLFDLLASRSGVTEPERPLPLPSPARGAITFDDVTFRYPSRPNDSALDHFSLTVQPGEAVALVGPSGAGKTTVFQLLLRFYEPSAGAIRLDGVDIAHTTLAELRGRLGLVSQEPLIFSASAADNIRYGRPGAADAELRRAAEAAHALEFIERLPQGFDTYLGERGVRLSGGQRQRIAIARAILRDPAVLLLDEATSALDAESEQLVQQALAVLMRGRTTLIIAHRLATVQSADRIAVLDDGRLVAIGSHAELARQGGLYARLASLQFDQPVEALRRAAGGE